MTIFTSFFCYLLSQGWGVIANLDDDDAKILSYWFVAGF